MLHGKFKEEIVKVERYISFHQGKGYTSQLSVVKYSSIFHVILQDTKENNSRNYKYSKYILMAWEGG